MPPCLCDCVIYTFVAKGQGVFLKVPNPQLLLIRHVANFLSMHWKVKVYFLEFITYRVSRLRRMTFLESPPGAVQVLTCEWDASFDLWMRCKFWFVLFIRFHFEVHWWLMKLISILQSNCGVASFLKLVVRMQEFPILSPQISE